MPTMTFYLGERGLFDACLAIEAVSNVRIMSASVDSNGFADVYYITQEPVIVIEHDYSCIHAADDEF